MIRLLIGHVLCYLGLHKRATSSCGCWDCVRPRCRAWGTATRGGMP